MITCIMWLTKLKKNYPFKIDCPVCELCTNNYENYFYVNYLLQINDFIHFMKFTTYIIYFFIKWTS